MNRRRQSKGRSNRRARGIRVPHWDPLADGCFILVGIPALLAIGLGLFIAWDYVDRTRYDRVIARVTSVERSCLLEHRSGGRTQTIRRTEEFPCADEAAWRADGARGQLIQVLTVTYRYISPRDGREYSGTLHRDSVDFPPGVRAGGSMPVYSLKADPSRSRGIYGWPVD